MSDKHVTRLKRDSEAVTDISYHRRTERVADGLLISVLSPQLASCNSCSGSLARGWGRAVCIKHCALGSARGYRITLSPACALREQYERGNYACDRAGDPGLPFVMTTAHMPATEAGHRKHYTSDKTGDSERRRGHKAHAGPEAGHIFGTRPRNESQSRRSWAYARRGEGVDSRWADAGRGPGIMDLPTPESRLRAVRPRDGLTLRRLVGRTSVRT